MDPTEDLSARVLLKHILSTEPPRTPITGSVSQEPRTSGTRRSERIREKDVRAQTPQDILRRNLKHRISESITRKSLPPGRTPSAVLRKTNMPTPTSMLFNDGDTPRHMLMNILRTEPAQTPVVHEKGPTGESEPPSANSTMTTMYPSIELTRLDLPDMTIGTAPNTAKGLSRKRPHQIINVTAFEKRLKAGDDAEEEIGKSIDDHSSLSLSSTSLSLKTPFVDVRTEKRGLQRRVANRRKITEEEFGAAVHRWQMEGVSRSTPVDQDLSETSDSKGFTLGLSKLSEPDITADIVNCNTALYAQPDEFPSNFSIVATQDKPTVMASRHQREEKTEAEQSELVKDKSMYVFPSDEGMVAEAQSVSDSQSQDDVDGTDGAAHGQSEDAAVMSETEKGATEPQTGVSGDTAVSKGEDNMVEVHIEEEGAVHSHIEEDVEVGLQSEEEEVAPDSQTEEEEKEEEEDEEEEEEEGVIESQTSVRGDTAESEEEENMVEGQNEEVGAFDAQSKEDVEADSQSDEGEVASDSQTEEEEKEEGAGASQTEEEAADLQSQEDAEARSQSEEDEDVAESQDKEDCDEEEEDSEQIIRRTRRSKDSLIVPVTEAGEDLSGTTAAGWSDSKTKAHGALDFRSSLEMGDHESSKPRIAEPDSAEYSTRGPADASRAENEPDADKENFLVPEVTHDIEDNGHLSDTSPEEAPEAEQEEEWDDEEDGDDSEDVPCETPAFVREKRCFFQRDPPASPSVLKNIRAGGTSSDLPAAKPKQVRQRKKGPPKKKACLPKSYLTSVFKHFAKTKVSADVYPVLNEIMEKFFDRLADDLTTYATHAKRKTIEVEDAVLLLKRQGYVTDKVPVEVLIEKYLRMEQRKLLIPIATSGNVVVPQKRR
ncbi:enolase-phosphatase E1 [Brachyistius frenatus]|uniref:enolase-phosphatase E1 n=1 Tax=Brachyistius frenatus TaxID=100188 RepID=UPI0037E7CD89